MHSDSNASSNVLSRIILSLFSLSVLISPVGATTSEAVFAGGCFWCIEAPFEKEVGVVEAISGYMGGSAEEAVYKKVASGKTKHREVVQVRYDPTQTNFRKLVWAFMRMYDPTDSGGSFYDRGFQYTSAIYYQTPEEKMIAHEVIAELEKRRIFRKKIVTPIIAQSTFYPAEPEHQDYYKKRPEHYQRYRKGSGRDRFNCQALAGKIISAADEAAILKTR